MKKNIVSIVLVCIFLFSLGFAWGDNTEEKTDNSKSADVSVILNGESEISWICGIPFEDPGYTAYGMNGEDLTEKVKIKGECLCWKVGDYELSYMLMDGRQVVASATRLVHVIPAELPETVRPHRTIYLTFDDGPCENTELVLETLAKYDVKATFFIVAERAPCHLEILPRIIAEGHTLGIHCYSHYIDGLYWDEASFFSDFMKAQKVVYQYTGTYAHVSRLPGGSRTAHNLIITLENGYDQLREMMHNMGVRYYDWNVQPETYESTDGVEYLFTHPDKDYDFAIVLQHDTKGYSVLALDSMIQWALKQGYSFAPIDLTTPEIQFY